MPKADALFNTNRRTLLAGIIAAPIVAVLPATAAEAVPVDAAFFAHYQKFNAVFRAAREMSRLPEPPANTPEGEAYEARFDALVSEECRLLSELAAMPAHTAQGQRIKAELILKLIPEHMAHTVIAEYDSNTQLVLSLARDLVRETVA
ncbi:hypothetical protein AA18889_1898 [Acetobacter senegalensis DSM 18889]|nr:hypothetical protein AA18889_1898 [Acetobacter senegalensis DSM 18889]